MSEEDLTWLGPIRAAAVAILADPPPLTAWEAGDEDNGDVADHDVEKLLLELGWPTRTRTYMARSTILGSSPRRLSEPRECTERYFPGTWLVGLAEHIARFVHVRDAGKEPEVPDRLRLRNLPQNADFEAFRDLVEGAWDYAGDELACSIAVMCSYDAMSMDGIRYNLAIYFWYGLHACDSEDTPPRNDEALSYEERLRREEADSFADLRNLPSPKWRAWYEDTWADRVAIHDTLAQCGVEVTSNLVTDLHHAGYTFESDVSQMRIEELVSRLEVRYRFFVSAFRAGRSPAGKQATFSPKRVSSRPENWGEIMETVAQLKRENVRWKEIRERVQAAHGYPFDSDEALRKQFERWQKDRSAAG